MPTSGFWNASFRHLHPRIYRIHPDQRQSGVCRGGTGSWDYTSEKAWFKLRHDQDGWCKGEGQTAQGWNASPWGLHWGVQAPIPRVFTAYILTKNSRLGFARAWRWRGGGWGGGPWPLLGISSPRSYCRRSVSISRQRAQVSPLTSMYNIYLSYIHTYIYIYIHIHTYIHTHAYIYIYIYMDIHVCMIYIYI